MPKVKSLRSKAGRHLSAPQAKRNAEVEDAADEEEVENSTADPESSATGKLNKKERRVFKREVFQEYVAESLGQAAQSKSALRRAKRREKERLAADMADMSAVLRTVIEDSALPVEADLEPSADAPIGGRKPKTREPSGRIGESGRTKPLSKQQKKRALELEQRRLPLILSHPQFMKDPFGTIRTHTSNVLTKVNPTTTSTT